MILGSGWAGYGVARILDPQKYERIVISPRSYFVFTPLLASTAVGTLEFRTVLEPIRRLGVQFHQGWADDIDFENKTIRVEANATDDTAQTLPPPPVLGLKGSSSLTEPVLAVSKPEKGEVFDVAYDKLIIAVGAYSQTFGIKGVRRYAHFLRDVGDARRIRLRVLSLFEQCSYPERDTGLTEQDKRDLLHFAIVGGGPTGIEFAAELHDLIHEDLRKMYPSLIPLVRITVYDVAAKILPMFDRALASYATEQFARQGIKVETEKHLDEIRQDAEGGKGVLRIKIREHGNTEMGAGLVVWSTGLMQNPVVEKIRSKKFRLPDAGLESRTYRLVGDSRNGGIMTDEHLRARIRSALSGTGGNENKAAEVSNSVKTSIASTTTNLEILPDVYVIGDCATVQGQEGLPRTAQVASQQASYLGRGLNKSKKGEDSRLAMGKPFRFHNMGTLTYLGGYKAMHQGDRSDLRGWMAWVLWRTAYLTRSMSWRNKLMVPVHWLITFLFGRDISRF